MSGPSWRGGAPAPAWRRRGDPPNPTAPPAWPAAADPALPRPSAHSPFDTGSSPSGVSARSLGKPRPSERPPSSGRSAPAPAPANVWFSQASSNSSLRIMKRDPAKMEQERRRPQQQLPPASEDRLSWPALGRSRTEAKVLRQPANLEKEEVVMKKKEEQAVERKKGAEVKMEKVVKKEEEEDEGEWQAVGAAGKRDKRAKEQVVDELPKEPREDKPVVVVADDNNAKPEMTEEERERARQKRRERRRQMKEKKRLEREEALRMSMYASKSTKIQVVTADQLRPRRAGAPAAAAPAAAASAGKDVGSVRKIRFMEEEYPSLAAAGEGRRKEELVLSRSAVDAHTGRVLSDAESGSEWETEDDGEGEGGGDDKGEGGEKDEEADEAAVDIKVDPDQSTFSYSSILKNKENNNACKKISKKVGVNAAANVAVKAAANVAVNATSAKEEEASKKVKKKDPITLDLFQALQTSKKSRNQEKKKSVLGSKVVGKRAPAPSASAAVGSRGGNVLDSSAPAIRRGKERERPKKKRATKVKKIILQEREQRREARLAERAARLAEKQEKAGQKEEKGAEETAQAEAVLTARLVEEADPEPTALAAVPAPESAPASSTVSAPASTPADDGGAPNSQLSSKEAANASAPEKPAPNEQEPTTEEDRAKKSIHSRKFRDYCDHVLSPDLDDLCKALLQDLLRFQDKQFLKDPLKAKAKRRYVIGLKEVKKFLQVKKVGLLVLAPDLERVQQKGGLNDLVAELKTMADLNGTPVVFVMNRYKLGKACRRKVPASCVGVLNYQGSEENFKKMTSLLPDLKAAYQERLRVALDRVGGEEKGQASSSSKAEIQNGGEAAADSTFAADSAPAADSASAPSSQAEAVRQEFMSKILALLKE